MIAIIAVFVAVGVPMFDKYTVKNDVITKAEEIKLLFETAQSISNNAEQGHQASIVRRGGDTIQLFNTIDNASCEVNPSISWNSLEPFEEINIQNYTIDSFADEAWICFAIDGSDKYFDGANVVPNFPAELEVSSGAFQSYDLGPAPKIIIRTIGRNQTGFKYIFSIE